MCSDISSPGGSCPSDPWCLGTFSPRELGERQLGPCLRNRLPPYLRLTRKTGVRHETLEVEGARDQRQDIDDEMVTVSMA